MSWKQVVELDYKQRFIIKNGRIRANQGHSIKVDLGLPSLKPPNGLYHGNATKFLDKIKIEGLNNQKRNYVHLTEYIETDLDVGNRYGIPMVLLINSKQMWLTINIPIDYIKYDY